jgi:hypothetical protein
MTINTTQRDDALAATGMRILNDAELDNVTGGAVNCQPVVGEDGKMYSPTLDGYPGGPLGPLLGLWKPFGFPTL